MDALLVKEDFYFSKRKMMEVLQVWVSGRLKDCTYKIRKTDQWFELDRFEARIVVNKLQRLLDEQENKTERL